MKICIIAPLVGAGLFWLALALPSDAAQYNPKELSVDKKVPWQKSRAKPRGKTISSTNQPGVKGKRKYDTIVFKKDIDAVTPLAEPTPNRRPGRTKYSNVVLKKAPVGKPRFSADPDASVPPARATTNVKLKEASRLSLPAQKPTASSSARPGRKQSNSAPKRSKDMILKGTQIKEN